MCTSGLSGNILTETPKSPGVPVVKAKDSRNEFLKSSPSVDLRRHRSIKPASSRERASHRHHPIEWDSAPTRLQLRSHSSQHRLCSSEQHTFTAQRSSKQHTLTAQRPSEQHTSTDQRPLPTTVRPRRHLNQEVPGRLSLLNVCRLPEGFPR